MKIKINPYRIIFCLIICAGPAFSAKSFAAPEMNFTAPKMMEVDEISKKASVGDKADPPQEVFRPPVVYSGAGLKDPFKPAVVEKKEDQAQAAQEEVKSLPEMKVQGLLWGGIFPQAIINNKVVKVGDMIGEAKVTGINKEGVTVLFANMEHKLSSPAVTGSQPSTGNNTAPTGKGESNEKPI